MRGNSRSLKLHQQLFSKELRVSSERELPLIVSIVLNYFLVVLNCLVVGVYPHFQLRIALKELLSISHNYKRFQRNLSKPFKP